MLLGILGALLAGLAVQWLIDCIRVVRSCAGSPGWVTLFQPGALLPGLLPASTRWNLTRALAWTKKADLYLEHNSSVLVLPHLFPTPAVTVLVGDMHSIKRVNSDHKHFAKTAGINIALLNQWGPNILTTDGTQWRRHRKIIGPTFTTENNEVVWQETTRASRLFFDHVDLGMAKNGRCVVERSEEHMATMTLMVICKAAFGYEMDYPSSLDHDQLQEMTFPESARIVLDSLLAIWALPRWAYKLPSEKLARLKAGSEFFESTVRKLVVDRRSSAEGERHDLLSALLAANDQETGSASLNEEELISDIFILMFAGHETSANTLSATLILLALYDNGIQDRMYEEAKALFGEDDSNPTSFSDLPSLSFCHAVLQEGLRLAGPVVWMAKECIAETTLSSVTRNGERAEVRVPKGALIRENFVAVHYDARVWEDPYAFKPERFLEKGKKGDSDGWLPFSSGLRGCIGKDFAITESVVFLALTLLHYRLEIPEHRKKEWATRDGESQLDRRERILSPRWSPTLAPHNLDVTFVRR